MTYRRQISIIGSRSLGDEALALVRTLSTRLVDEGYRIVTGGLGSLPNAVHQGATSSTSCTGGDTIALLPGFDPEPAIGHADIIIPTGLDIARNALVANGDAVIAIGGGAGTLSEIAFAWQMNRPIISLGFDGWSEKLAGETIDLRFPEKAIIFCDSIDAVIKTLAEELKSDYRRHHRIE
jgi:uncharacterized protein (TIGR00725 family)|tara:strand:- start:53 stop:592 length:540 start_codon:yes stop_codon:yes gene_type:complete